MPPVNHPSPPPVLLETWLPLAEIGVESRRERAASSALPPLYFLHVWWARRPLVACRAAILGSLLPPWREDWPAPLRDKFPTEASYQAWFRRLLGIHGDPVAAQKLLDHVRLEGIRIKNPHDFARAFTYNPETDELDIFLKLLKYNWGSDELITMDPMAGGGSIPFESLRFGLTTYVYEINPVASVILLATLDYPARLGESFSNKISLWGNKLNKETREKLREFFPNGEGEVVFTYIWARTVACPTTGKPVPLSPNWWLQKGENPVAVELLVDPAWPECRFRILKGEKARQAQPDNGTIKKGVARSPWTGETIDGDYIKREAQAGRMGQQLYALSIKTSRGYEFRAPTAADLEGVARAEAALQEKLPLWDAQGLIPREPIPEGNKTREPHNYGMSHWSDLLSPRQLLALGTWVETFWELRPKWRRALPPEEADALETYLSFSFSKTINYNSRMSVWHPLRVCIANTFDRHDFSFKWSHAEFDAAHNLFPWVIDQVIDSYKGLADLTKPAQLSLFRREGKSPVERLEIRQGNAADLSHLPDGSVHLICVDPPYYANVMYAELADFFYVWQKRLLQDTFPELFQAELTDKEEEAVANVARFASFGRKRQDLARADYERKMAACFREWRRVLKPEGVLTVMFTHKEAAAWDTLATALLAAGFVVQASWPIHTESEHSLHQAKKSAAASTILLICRRRSQETGTDPAWWDDLKATVRQVAREKAQEFQDKGISGVDLYLSTYGPVLSVISQKWPVLTSELDPTTGQPRALKPEEALNLARQEVLALRKQGLLLGRSLQFDPVTDWYLLAWDAFQAGEFPADEARKLALSLGLDLEETLVRSKQLLTKKQNFVAFTAPQDRRRRGMVDPEAASFSDLIDAVHTAMLVYQEDGSGAAQRFLQRSGLLYDNGFQNCLQALLNAIPRTKDARGHFLRPEADLLEKLRLAFFPELTVPKEPEPPATLPKPGKLDFAEPEEEELEEGEEDEQ